MFRVNYIQPSDSLSYDQRHLGPGAEKLVGQIDTQAIEITDARPTAAEFSLDKQGFELLQKVGFDFHQFSRDDQVKTVFYPQIAFWLTDYLQAKHVLVFDHTYRSLEKQEKTVHNRAPVKTVHNDYTASSAEYRLGQEARRLPAIRYQRHQFINIWLPLNHPVEESPLAMVDLSSAKAADYHPLKLLYPDRVGELAGISFNAQHRWYYFSAMQPGEALLLKVFDSNERSRRNGVPHAAVEAINAPPARHLRNSLELRSIAFF